MSSEELDGGVDRAVRRDEHQRLSSTEGHAIYLHNVGGKEPDGKPTRLGKWTFGTKMVKDVVLDNVDGRVLNACAGKTRLQKRGCEFFRNDIDEERDADLHVDVREIHQHLEPQTFDAAILDPPFDPGRAEKLYEGWHGQEYSNARDAVGQLVCPGGTVVELGWNSWSLSDKDGWEPVEHHIYRQSSFKADVHLTVDRKVNQKRLVTDGGVDQQGDDDDRLVCLDLFAGLRGFSAAFKESERWEVVTVELEERFDPDIQADIMDLRPADLPDADVVLASPPCTQFSMAASRYRRFVDGEPQTEDARDAVALVYHTIGLIKAITPAYWFLENPQGYLRQVIGHPTGRVTYCQYGTAYMKPTDLWGDHPPGMTYRACSYGDDCHRFNTDQENGGLGNMNRIQEYTRDAAKRAKVPFELSDSIREAVEAAIKEPTTEQSDLSEVRARAE